MDSEKPMKSEKVINYRGNEYVLKGYLIDHEGEVYLYFERKCQDLREILLVPKEYVELHGNEYKFIWE